MKYPLGRLVITATCRPGLPMVVRFLVRSSVRPAAAPDRTWTAASRSGPDAAAASDAAAGGGAAAAGAAGGGEAGAGAGAGVGAAGLATGRVLSSSTGALTLVCVAPRS